MSGTFPRKAPTKNKPGTAQVGAIAKAQKKQNDFKVSCTLFYSSRMRKKFPIFFLIFLKFLVSRIVPKNLKGGLWNFSNIHSVAKEKKIEGGTLWRHWKNLQKKVSRSRNNKQKIIGHGRDSIPRPSAWQTSKNPKWFLCQVPVKVVWQLALVQASL